MPISSMNTRLTHELYKPPPKTLEQLRFEGSPLSKGKGSTFGFHGVSSIVTPTGSPLVREKHLTGAHKKVNTLNFLLPVAYRETNLGRRGTEHL